MPGRPGPLVGSGRPGFPGYSRTGCSSRPDDAARPAPRSPVTQARQRNSGLHAHLRDPHPLARLLRRERARDPPLGVPGLPGALDPVHRRRHGALHPLHPGHGAAALAARGQRAEVHPHQRHRQRRAHHAPRHLLPDERQLLLRGLLQGGGHRLRLGAADLRDGPGRLRAGRREAVDDDLGGGRGLLGPPDQDDRGARAPRPEAPLRRDLLVHRPARARRLLL